MRKLSRNIYLLLVCTLLGACQYHGKQQAEEALNITKDLYKNYAHFSNDSLIRTAVNYYLENGSNEEKSEALFYLGCVQLELGQNDQAGFSFLQALGHGEDTNNYYVLGQACMQLSLLLNKSHCSEEEAYARKALDYYRLGNLKLYQCDALIHIANAKRHNLEIDSCRYYLLTADSLAQSIGDSLAMGYALYGKIQLDLLEENFSEALKGYSQLFDAYRYSARMEDYCNMASIYANQGQDTEAEDFLGKARSLANGDELLVIFYSNASRIFGNTGKKEKEYLYKDSLLLLSRDLIVNGRRNSINAFQRDFAEQQQIQAQKKMHVRSLFLGFLLIIFLLVVALCFFEIRRQRLMASLQEQKIHTLEYDLANVSSEYEEQVRQLKESDIVQQISESVRLCKPVSSEALRQLFLTISQKIPAFEQRLKEVYSPTETEWQICMLIKVGFTPSDIALLANKTPSAISAIRSRLYMKTFQRKGSPAEWDDFIARL